MIAYLKGNLFYKCPEHVIVDTQGVGYQVFVPLSTFYGLPDTGHPVSLRIHTHMVENSIKLYGFQTEEELKLFESLISINKVGPKLALAILSGISVGELVRAVSDNDLARLNSIPGVGKKTAERLILEIRDKLPNLLEQFEPQTVSVPAGGALEDALSALINLGYKKADAEKVLKKAHETLNGQGTLEDYIKESLKHLA